MNWYMQITPITEVNAHIFDVFEQDYEAEFSALTKKEPDVEGRFAIEANWHPPNSGFYLFLQEKPAGFAIRSEADGYSDIAEFYILPCYRKKGLGKLFAFTLFNTFRGPWQVRQIQTATAAIMFWRAVIHEYTQGNYTEDMTHDPYWGTVICQRFISQSVQG
jgi:predicted acetyltransferase